MAQVQDFYSTAYFHENVYLHDDTNAPISARIPTGNLMRVLSADVVSPSGDLIINGSITLQTNRIFRMLYKPTVDAVQTSVTINANGELVLNRFVQGVGWTNVIINPTNPLPSSMMSEQDPVYMADLAGGVLATGLPVYVETDPVWTQALSSGFSIGGPITNNFGIYSANVSAALSVASNLTIQAGNGQEGTESTGGDLILSAGDGYHAGHVIISAGTFYGLPAFSGDVRIYALGYESEIICQSPKKIELTSGDVIFIASNGAVDIDGCIISNGYITGNGGGISNIQPPSIAHAWTGSYMVDGTNYYITNGLIC
ncbi:MAG: hypothetical protein B6244_14305, partial [Candidatus Cloacimonetes bacterium 4572_55]